MRKSFADQSRAEQVWDTMFDKSGILLISSIRASEYIIDTYDNIFNLPNLEDYYVVKTGTGISLKKIDELNTKKANQRNKDYIW